MSLSFLQQHHNIIYTMERRNMSSPTVPAEGASLPEPSPKKRIRGAAMAQKCWWLLIPMVIAIVTVVFLPPQFRPNFVSRRDYLFFRFVCLSDSRFHPLGFDGPRASSSTGIIVGMQQVTKIFRGTFAFSLP
jgi:hypothetical protein